MCIGIAQYVRAGYPLLYVLTHEPLRVQLELYNTSIALGRDFYQWSVANGMIHMQENGEIVREECGDPIESMTKIAEELPDRSIVMMTNMHLFLEERDPFIIDMLCRTMNVCKKKGKIMVIVGCTLNLPPEIEKDVAVYDYELPDKKALKPVLKRVAKIVKGSLHGKKKLVDEVLDSARGLTTVEAENAFSLSYVAKGEFDPHIVAQEKVNVIKKTGLLEIVDPTETLDSIGGLEYLVQWLVQRKNAFSEDARKFGLPFPRGVLIIGIPGTGKSLTAKATSSIFGHPLIKLDAGKIFAGIVGQSESNLRAITKTAEAIAPCILWIDEIEKGFSGSKSSNMTDGGTSSRVFGNFISWMQDKKSPVFVVATANDVSQLPPEFLRKGRFDELWFVDLPTVAERSKIWEIQIKKYGRKPSSFDLDSLVTHSDGMTGAEIESAFVDSMFESFAAEDKQVSMDAVLGCLQRTVPLSKTMGEEIRHLQKWSHGRARPASRPSEKKIVEETGRVIETIAGKKSSFPIDGEPF